MIFEISYDFFVFENTLDRMNFDFAQTERLSSKKKTIYAHTVEAIKTLPLENFAQWWNSLEDPDALMSEFSYNIQSGYFEALRTHTSELVRSARQIIREGKLVFSSTEEGIRFVINETEYILFTPDGSIQYVKAERFKLFMVQTFSGIGLPKEEIVIKKKYNKKTWYAVAY